MEFTLKTGIEAPAEAIYKALLSTKGQTNMTGGTATSSNKGGGSFTAWDGYIQGKNKILEPLWPYSAILEDLTI